MKNLEITQNQLKSGDILVIPTISDIDSRDAEIAYRNWVNWGEFRFYLWFNGTLIYSSKTYKSLLNRIKKLDQKFPLDFSNQTIRN